MLQLLMGFFRIGFFMNFVSEPVIAGFTSAAAFLIASTQVTLTVVALAFGAISCRAVRCCH